MIRDRLAETKTSVVGLAMIDEGNWVNIRYENASVSLPLNILPYPLQVKIKNDEDIKIKITFEMTSEEITEVK